MKALLLPLTILALGQPALAAVPDVVQPGDRAMTCPALAAAINDLAAAAPPARKKHGFLKVLGTAATLMPGVALVKSAALMSAAGAAQAGLAQAAARPAPAVSDTDVEATAARRTRLTALFDAKGC